MKIVIKKATADDCKFLLNLRNDPTVRKASFNENVIKSADHDEWFFKAIKDTDIAIYIGKDGEKPFGYVRFNRHGKDAEISIAINREFRGRGFGGVVLKEAIRLYGRSIPDLRKITAKIKKENTKSEALFLKSGFVHINPSKGDDCIEMQLLISK